MSNHTVSNNTIYLPWSWTIVSTNQTAHPCPSESSILGTFAAVNILASLLAVVFGHRAVVELLTRGKFGKRKSKNSWIWNWTLPLGLNLVANAIIAGILKNTTGYKANYKIWELMLFLLARPRLNWIVMAFLVDKLPITASKPIETTQQIPMQRPGLLGQGQRYTAIPDHYVHGMPAVSMHGIPNGFVTQSTSTLGKGVFTNEIHEVPGTGPIAIPVERVYDLPYLNTFISSFIAEVLMQLGALYIMGTTVRFAWDRGYYNVGLNHKLYKSVPHGAHIMYAGALYYLIGGSLSLAFTVFSLYVKFPTKKDVDHKTWPIRGIRLFPVLALLATTFLGSWLFWAGFVKLAGDFYCPPKLTSQAAVWTFASMIGSFFGAGA